MVPTGIANGSLPSAAAPAGSGAAGMAGVGEAEREAVAAKAGFGKVGAIKGGAAKTIASKVAPIAQGNIAAGGKMAVGAGGTGAKLVSGSFWTGLGLGLVLGLGPLGPVLLGVVAAAAVYAYWKSRDTEAAQSDEEIELREALT